MAIHFVLISILLAIGVHQGTYAYIHICTNVHTHVHAYSVNVQSSFQNLPVSHKKILGIALVETSFGS